MHSVVTPQSSQMMSSHLSKLIGWIISRSSVLTVSILYHSKILYRQSHDFLNMTWPLKTKCSVFFVVFFLFYRRPVLLQFPDWNKIPEIRGCLILPVRSKRVPINPVLRIYSKLKKRGMGNEWWKWGLPEVMLGFWLDVEWGKKNFIETSLVTERPNM